MGQREEDYGAVLGEEFLRIARSELAQCASRVTDCLSKLTLDQIWHRDRAIENSVGNLVLHIAGNLGQWIVSGVGGLPDSRNRDWEFANRRQIPAEELQDRLGRTVAAADRVLEKLDTATLTERREIQVYQGISVLQAITHVLTHFSGHTGQIIWMTKHMTGRDLGYYGYLAAGGSAQPDVTP